MMSIDGRIERARQSYEQAVFGGDLGGLAAAERDLDAVEADVALARGRLLHARYLDDRQENPDEVALFERAARLYRSLGDVRGEGEAMFWLGTFDQVVRGDNTAALPALQRSYELAAQAGDKLTLSYAVRHLGFAELAAGRLEAARIQLAESVRLRREIGFLPGVAAGLVALAALARLEGSRDEALAQLEEARAIAEASGARGVLRHVDEARTRIVAA